MPKQKERTKVKPVKELRLGRLVAAIWENHVEGGATRYNVTLSRLYKPEGEQWQNSSSFGRDDLLPLAKLIDLTHTWICQHMQEQNDSSKENDSPHSEEPEPHF